MNKENNIGTLNINGEAVTSPKEKAKAMNPFFANVGKIGLQSTHTGKLSQPYIQSYANC